MSITVGERPGEPANCARAVFAVTHAESNWLLTKNRFGRREVLSCHLSRLP